MNADLIKDTKSRIKVLEQDISDLNEAKRIYTKSIQRMGEELKALRDIEQTLEELRLAKLSE